MKPFDQSVREKYTLNQQKFNNTMYRPWTDKRKKYMNDKRKEFNKQLKQDIKNGKYILEERDTFSTYYDSLEWSNTRERILLRDNHECQVCQNDATQVHHILYEHLGKENDCDLISVCKKCHKEIHKLQKKLPSFYKLTPIETVTLKEWSFEENKSGK